MTYDKMDSEFEKFFGRLISALRDSKADNTDLVLAQRELIESVYKSGFLDGRDFARDEASNNLWGVLWPKSSAGKNGPT